MILCGLETEWINCAGNSSRRKHFFKAKNIHEAAIETLKYNHSNSFQSTRVINGEFHDTDTFNTWSVDSGGYTKYDYYREHDLVFEKRWTNDA